MNVEPGTQDGRSCSRDRLLDLIEAAYEAVFDAAETGEPIYFETAGRPLADAIALLWGRAE